ncbi:hypothetical protein ACJW30_12G026400 [Castanea mollissima]
MSTFHDMSAESKQLSVQLDINHTVHKFINNSLSPILKFPNPYANSKQWLNSVYIHRVGSKQQQMRMYCTCRVLSVRTPKLSSAPQHHTQEGIFYHPDISHSSHMGVNRTTILYWYIQLI